MKKELQEKLYNDFPQLFQDKGKSAEETPMFWGCSIGNGWYDLMHKACEKLMQLGLPEDFRFVQIKEKFGGLRAYTSGVSKDMYQAVTDIIHEAEDEADETCEYCGSKENVTQAGSWIKTLCSECRDNNVKTWEE